MFHFRAALLGRVDVTSLPFSLFLASVGPALSSSFSVEAALRLRLRAEEKKNISLLVYLLNIFLNN